MILVVNMIPNSLSGETNQDSEPNLTVNPVNPRQIVGSAFTPNPLGGVNAPIFVSSNGGQTWLLSAIVPSSAGGSPADITVRFARSSSLYAGILRRPDSRLNVLRTANVQDGALMTVLIDRGGVDQPYVQTALGPGNDRVFVGDNDHAAGAASATIDLSQNAGGAPPSGFGSARIETRPTAGQDGPPIRPAVHWDGTVYAAFYRWTSSTDWSATADVVVVRDDRFASGAGPFTALKDPSDNRAGRLVVTGRTVPLADIHQADFGQERFVGSHLSIAVDPWNSSRVYLAWADRVGLNDYTLHVRRSTDRGLTWSGDIRTITNAINPALAVTDTGVLGFMYQQVSGTGSTQRWITRLERTVNDFFEIDSRDLAKVPANAPPPQFLPYIGDYIHILSIGSDLYGIFSSNNAPISANFPSGVVYQRNADFIPGHLLANDHTTQVDVSIDPFFVKATGQLGSAVASWSADRLDSFMVGIDGSCQHKWWDRSMWGPSTTGWESLGGALVGVPIAVSWGPGRLDVFAVGTDGPLRHKWWDRSMWGPSTTGWESLGGLLQSGPQGRPAAVSWGPDRLDLFIVGTDQAVSWKYWAGGAWGPSMTGWQSLGGTCASQPVAVAWGSNRLDLFMIGVDGALHHKWWGGAAWGPSTTGWESLGGTWVGSPVAVSWDTDRLDVFAVGTDGALYHKWWDRSMWGPSATAWESLGGRVGSQPAAVSWGPDRLDVFFLGTDRALYHKYWAGGAWGLAGWESLGGTWVGTPVLNAWGPDRLDVFALGTDRALHHKWWDRSMWGPSTTGWESLGGVVDL